MSNNTKLRIACVILKSCDELNNEDYTRIIEKILFRIDNQIDILLFPAGFYSTDYQARTLYKKTVEIVKKLLKLANKHCIVCLGIDGRDGIDQIALAINENGILAMGRKFHPTSEEHGCIDIAEDHLSTEDDYSRIFKVRDKKIYMAVCYDGFGIRQKHLENPGIEIVLDLVHGFYPKGEGDSGEVYFARHGFAGASKQWGCYVFGAANFFNREIPEYWPAGVYWNQGDKSTRQWKYGDNGIKPIDKIWINSERISALVKIYEVYDNYSDTKEY